MSRKLNLFAPDGYRYGVRFESDGTVASPWNGHTQREQAQAEHDRLTRVYAPDRFTLVRRLPGADWEDA